LEFKTEIETTVPCAYTFTLINH